MTHKDKLHAIAKTIDTAFPGEAAKLRAIAEALDDPKHGSKHSHKPEPEDGPTEPPDGP